MIVPNVLTSLLFKKVPEVMETEEQSAVTPRSRARQVREEHPALVPETPAATSITDER